MLGYTEEEIGRLTFLELTHEDYRESNWQLVTELLEGKRRQFQIEKQYRRKDGSLIWVSNNVSLVPGTKSMPRFIMALSEDITERKQTEEMLRRSKADLLEAQRLTHTGNWKHGVSSGRYTISPETYRIFGINLKSNRGPLNCGLAGFILRIGGAFRSYFKRAKSEKSIIKQTIALFFPTETSGTSILSAIPS
jgi:PAS domain S-box-containing protein